MRRAKMTSVSGWRNSALHVFTLAALLLQLVLVSVQLQESVAAAASVAPKNQRVRSGTDSDTDTSSGSAATARTLQSAGSTATDLTKTYVLFKIPNFEIVMTFPDPGFLNHKGQTVLMDVDESLDAITSRYLFAFVYEYLQGLAEEDGRPLGQRLHNMDVRCTLYEVDAYGNVLTEPDDDGRRLLRARASATAPPNAGAVATSARTLTSFVPTDNGGADANSIAGGSDAGGEKYILAVFGGTASFEDARFDPSDFAEDPASSPESGNSYDVDQPTVRLMVMKAFKETSAYLQELRGATDHIVASVRAVAIRTNLDLELGGGNGDSGQIGGPPFTSTSAKGLNEKESVAIAAMAVFLAFFLAFIYVYMSREYHAMHKGRSPTNVAIQRNADGTLQFQRKDDNALFGAGCSAAEGQRRMNGDIVLDPAVGAGGDVVQAASPFEVVYGAAFRPSEREMVQKHYSSGGNSGMGRGGSKGKKIPRAPIRPMMTLVEEEEPAEHRVGEVLGSSSHHSGGRAGIFSHDPVAFKAALPLVHPGSIIKSVSSFLEGRSGSQHGVASSPTSVDDFDGVYRDFPRHDGTPCLMFTDDTVEWNTGFRGIEEQNATGRSAPPEEGELNVEDMEDAEDEGLHNEATNIDFNSVDEGIDNFVDKLERLILLKSRQYDERVRMEWERSERKKERDERRRKEREALSSGKSRGDSPAASAEIDSRDRKQPLQLGSIPSNEDMEPTSPELL